LGIKKIAKDGTSLRSRKSFRNEIGLINESGEGAFIDDVESIIFVCLSNPFPNER